MTTSREHSDDLFASVVELFDACDFSLFYDEEILTFISLFEHVVIVLKVMRLQSIDKLKLLGFLERIKQCYFLQKAGLNNSLVYARLNYDGLEGLAVENVGLALFFCFNGGGSFVVVHQSNFSEACTFGQYFGEKHLRFKLRISWMGVSLIDHNLDTTLRQNEVLVANIAILDDEITLTELPGLHRTSDPLDIFSFKFLAEKRLLEQADDFLELFRWFWIKWNFIEVQILEIHFTEHGATLVGAILLVRDLLYETVGTLSCWRLRNWPLRYLIQARYEQLRGRDLSRRIGPRSSLIGRPHFKRPESASLLLRLISHLETSKRASTLTCLLLIFLGFGLTHTKATKCSSILFYGLIFLLLRLGHFSLLLLLPILHSLNLLFILNESRPNLILKWPFVPAPRSDSSLLNLWLLFLFGFLIIGH